MIRPNEIGSFRVRHGATRSYNAPLEVGRKILHPAYQGLNLVNAKPCNGRKRGGMILSSFSFHEINGRALIEINYVFLQSACMRVGSRSFQKYLYGDLRKIFKRLAPYRIASDQKAETSHE